MLKSYRWFMAITDNEEFNAPTGVGTQQNALEVALDLLKLEKEGSRIVQKWTIAG